MIALSESSIKVVSSIGFIGKRLIQAGVRGRTTLPTGTSAIVFHGSVFLLLRFAMRGFNS